MAINVTKIGSDKFDDIFTYRDDYNDEFTVRFPKFMGMTEQDVDDYLNA